MWDLIVSVPDHCLSFNFLNYIAETAEEIAMEGYALTLPRPQRR